MYPGTPPAATTVAPPFDPPLQDTFVDELIVAVSAGACVRLNVRVVVQELASVTVTVQTPAVRPVTLGVPSPVGLPGVQLYVSVPVPPEAVALAAPLLPPKQATFVWDIGATTMGGGCVSVNVFVIDAELASVIVTV